MSDPVTDSQTSAGVRPWAAALLSLLYPGLGHVYLREWLRASMWFLLALATGVLLIPPELATSQFSFQSVVRASKQLSFGGTLTMLAVTVLSMVDAYWLAMRRRHVEAETDEEQRCPECGREIEEDLDFCHWCTARFEESESA